MATGILAILDDVAMLLDDTATMGKVAAEKTAGLLGDDLAVNAEKATGFHASRELPVIWAITKGSFLNKVIILPCALLINAFAPWLLVPILLLGGTYLSYEGVEHIFHWLSHRHDPVEDKVKTKKAKPAEPQKIKSAIRTDFILSIEIIVISLAAVAGQAMAVQVLVVVGIALLATIGVYGLVAVIVRLDDMGFYLITRAESDESRVPSFAKGFGQALVALLPKIIWLLSIVGTLAMLLVGGGIYTHYVDFIHHLAVHLPGLLADLLTGILVGCVAVVLIGLFTRLKVSGPEPAS